MWIPSWLGEIYSRLRTKFGCDLFTFQEAKDLLSADENRLAVALSKLHSHRILLVFETGRPRFYRVLDPRSFISLASGVIQNVEKIVQERYVELLCGAFRLVSEWFDLTSFAVYGTVARGTARRDSDVDVLLVSDDFVGSLGSRIERVCRVEDELREELAWLRRHGVYTGLSFYPLRREEAEKTPLLFLDLTEDAVIFYDENRFLETVLTVVKGRLLKRGAKRVFLDEERWYWDLKPDYKFGEKVTI